MSYIFENIFGQKSMTITECSGIYLLVEITKLEIVKSLQSLSVIFRRTLLIGSPAIAGRVWWIRIDLFLCPSGSFLGIDSLVFSEILRGITGPYGESFFFFIEENIVFSGNDRKWKHLWPCNFLWKLALEKIALHALENLVLKLWQKMLLTNKISIFFNCQYFINTLTSDFDFFSM